jgi:hypothetical protein
VKDGTKKQGRRKSFRPAKDGGDLLAARARRDLDAAIQRGNVGAALFALLRCLPADPPAEAADAKATRRAAKVRACVVAVALSAHAEDPIRAAQDELARFDPRAKREDLADRIAARVRRAELDAYRIAAEAEAQGRELTDEERAEAGKQRQVEAIARELGVSPAEVDRQILIAGVRAACGPMADVTRTRELYEIASAAFPSAPWDLPALRGAAKTTDAQAWTLANAILRLFPELAPRSDAERATWADELPATIYENKPRSGGDGWEVVRGALRDAGATTQQIDLWLSAHRKKAARSARKRRRA